jgi:Zn-dependent protease with chaperone function
MRISPEEFIHPQDQAALESLHAIPLFTACLKVFMKIVSEEFLHGMNMAQKIRLGPDQLPEIYGLLPPVCERLGIDPPELYLEMDPVPNAYTFGDSRVFITLTSGLVDALERSELEAVIAHECGHILCRHVLYHTMAAWLARFGAAVLGPLAAASTPVQLALLYWDRRSELSADRAAALAAGSPDPVIATMIRLAGGPKRITGSVNVDRYVEQAETYDKLLESRWDRLLQGVAVMEQNHPFLAVRTKEIRDWCAAGQFSQLVEGLRRAVSSGGCPACGMPLPAGWKFCSHCGAKAAQAAQQ